MPDHTPTPWRIVESSDHTWTVKGENNTTLARGGESAVAFRWRWERIVRAVNNFEPMLEACMIALAACSQEWLYQTGQTVRPARNYPEQGTVCPEMGDAMGALTAAIAKAEEDA